MTEKKNQGTLTQGPIVKTLMSLAVPIMASSFLGTAYNICDMAWVGTLGARAVAGVGVGGMYLWLFGGAASLPRIGGQVLTAQALGSARMDDAKKFARAAIQIVILLSVFFAITGLFFSDVLISFFDLGDEVSIGVAFRYTRITCGCIIFSFLNLTLNGLYTAMGDSKTPMYANFCGLTLNMILDPLLITGVGVFPRLEADGAAAATVISQAVVTVLLVMGARRTGNDSIFSEQQYHRPCERAYYKHIFRIGIPAALQNIIFCFISMVLTRLIAGFGPEAVAVQRVGGQIESVTWNTADGFGSALNSFCAQNYGAGKYHRIRKGYQFSAAVNFIWGAAVMLIFVCFPTAISNIFFHETEVIAVSVSYLIVIGLSEPFLALEMVTCGAISGLGKTKLCSCLSIVLTGLRIPLAVILTGTVLGLNGIWWALTLTSMIKGVIFMMVFWGIVKKKETRQEVWDS